MYIYFLVKSDDDKVRRQNSPQQNKTVWKTGSQFRIEI